jgi:hypothetical protein
MSKAESEGVNGQESIVNCCNTPPWKEGGGKKTKALFETFPRTERVPGHHQKRSAHRTVPGIVRTGTGRYLVLRASFPVRDWTPRGLFFAGTADDRTDIYSSYEE